MISSLFDFVTLLPSLSSAPLLLCCAAPQAELRAAVFSAISDEERSRGIHRENKVIAEVAASQRGKTVRRTPVMSTSYSCTGLLLLSLVRDALKTLKLDFTLSCFDAEATLVGCAASRCSMFLLLSIDFFLLALSSSSLAFHRCSCCLHVAISSSSLPPLSSQASPLSLLRIHSRSWIPVT